MAFKVTKNIGLLLLAIWLIAIGIQAFVPMAGLGLLTGALAIAAGVFILIGR